MPKTVKEQETIICPNGWTDCDLCANWDNWLKDCKIKREDEQNEQTGA